ncbi:dihydropteroate synthase [Amycolatopsis rhabdoformis]|uniref:Dihydropteroate synthase n=1 Tax=Amycolatopsis rhabdoformis TaxID=1448059 RepID=A0ABZ1I7W4_9PSEU|nr:dihydropteroate synthase [Amycolatopsis rhabdoformis]WSE29927.1 dihydropteroate synthase [Amycolatopsis rhabdoformis]
MTDRRVRSSDRAANPVRYSVDGRAGAGPVDDHPAGGLDRAGPARSRVAGLPCHGGRLVLGILNVTPDSFSDGGLHLDPAIAVEHGWELAASGADVVDVGGESTRPGAARVSAETELSRVRPVVRGLVAAGIPVSIDTTRAEVAREALDLGAVMINDVSGGLADPAMAGVAAAGSAAYVAMHWRGPSGTMRRSAVYVDVVATVVDELARRVEALLAGGVDPARLILDPGLGFAKTAAHDWALLNGLDRVVGLGYPVLVGASRKSFLAAGRSDGAPAERDTATAVVSALAAQAGVHALRVHDPRSTREALAVVDAWAAARSGAARMAEVAPPALSAR